MTNLRIRTLGLALAVAMAVPVGVIVELPPGVARELATDCGSRPVRVGLSVAVGERLPKGLEATLRTAIEARLHTVDLYADEGTGQYLRLVVLGYPTTVGGREVGFDWVTIL